MGTVPPFTDGIAAHQADLAWWQSTRPLWMGTQGTADTAWAAATFTPIVFDTDVMIRDSTQHSTSTNPSRFIIGKTLGWYEVSGNVAYASNSTGSRRRAGVFVNGTIINGSLTSVPISSTALPSVLIASIYVQATAVTDYVEIQADHDATSSIGTSVSGSYRSLMTVSSSATSDPPHTPFVGGGLPHVWTDGATTMTATLFGVDVSHYQGTINWHAASAAGVAFAFCKATEGTTWTDPNFAANHGAAKAAGLVVGGYHFLRPGGATAQAKHYADCDR